VSDVVTHEDAVIAEAREREARIIAEAQQTKREQSAQLERMFATLDACPDCGKTRSVGVVAAKYRGRFQAELPTPQTSCACPNGIVARADEWSVEFVRGYQDVGRALLRPASSAYGVISLRPQIAPGDTVPVGPSRFIPDAIAFEWAEESPACRRLAFTMLALVTSTTVADRWAEAYMRDVLAKQLAKQSSRTQRITVGEIRAWLAAHEAVAAA
jgi:hypothetical protein